MARVVDRVTSIEEGAARPLSFCSEPVTETARPVAPISGAVPGRTVVAPKAPDLRRMPSPRRQAISAAEPTLDETPDGRLQEDELKRLMGYQVAQANVVTLAVFQEVVGKPLGLRTVEYTVLALIASNGEASPAQLAKALNLSPSYITMALDKLAGKGLVRRETDERDRRAQRLHATRQGRAQVGQMTQALLEAERRLFSGALSEVEQLMLKELLHKLARTRRPA